MKFPWLTEAEIESHASALLTRVFGAGLDRSCPVDLDDVVVHLSEEEGLSFNDDADLGRADGDVILGTTQPLRRRILLSRDLKLDGNAGRSRFTLAHELGHWVLHRPLFVAKAAELSLFGPEDEGEFKFVGLQRAIFPPRSGVPVPTEEWQANRFAVSLLIDGNTLREEFSRRFGALVVARQTPAWDHSPTLRAHARHLASAARGGSVPLRDVFGISAEAMAVALESRGYAVEEPPLV